MGHCLGSLDWQHAMAHAGRLVAFAVTQPTRLTLAFWRDDDGTWLPHDFAGPHNDPPPREALPWAQSLLARFNQAAPPQVLPLGP